MNTKKNDGTPERELAAALNEHSVDDIRKRVVEAIAQIGNARSALVESVREICPEIDGCSDAAARSLNGGAR